MSLESAGRDRQRRVGFPMRSGPRLALLAGAAGAALAVPLAMLAHQGASSAAPGSAVRDTVGASAAGQSSRGALRPAQPGVVALRIAADADTTVASSQPDQPLGDAPTLVVGREAGPYSTTYETLLHFSLTEVPAGATVVSATLELAQLAAEGQASMRTDLAVVTAAWSEASTSWGNRPASGFRTAFAYVPDAAGKVTWDATAAVIAWQGGVANLGLRLSADETTCEAGRSRSFASREAGGGSQAPTLIIQYVGPGTPHPFPSATASPTPTSTPTVPGTPPPTVTPTPTSNRPSPGWMLPVEPAPGAVLKPPVGRDRWVFRWRWTQFTPPCQSVTLTLAGPAGQRITVPQGFTYAECLTYAIEGPPPADMYGAWTWQMSATCAPFGGGFVPAQSFTVRPLISPTPPRVATATATARPLALPRLLREATPAP